MITIPPHKYDRLHWIRAKLFAVAYNADAMPVDRWPEQTPAFRAEVHRLAGIPLYEDDPAYWEGAA